MTLEDDALYRLLKADESDRIERKRNAEATDKIRETICAFANDVSGRGEPGVIFVGVEDDGRPSGFAIDDGLRLKIAQMRDDGAIIPFPRIELRDLTFGESQVLTVIVEPSEDPPVRYNG